MIEIHTSTIFKQTAVCSAVYNFKNRDIDRWRHQWQRCLHVSDRINPSGG